MPIKGIARQSGESYLDALKASQGFATLDSMGRKIRWIRDLSGQFSYTGALSADGYVELGYTAATIMTTPVKLYTDDVGGANGGGTVCVNGWLQDGQFTNCIVEAHTTTETIVPKNFMFLPHRKTMRMINGDALTGTVLALEATGGTSAYALMTYATSAYNSDPLSYVAVPPGGFAKISYLNCGYTTNSTEDAIFEIHSCKANVTSLADYEILISKTCAAAGTDLIARTDTPVLVAGGQYGRIIRIYFNEGTNGCSAQAIKMSVDVFAEWNNEWEKVAEALDKDYANERN